MMLRALLAAVLLAVSWDATAVDCHGRQLLSPIDHYDVRAFRAELVDWIPDPESGELQPVYWRSVATQTLGAVTELTIALDPGDVVGWEGMWDAAWQIQPPEVEAFTVAGVGSSAPCQP